MPYWKECPKCGCHLDPGERCDCEAEKKDKPMDREMKSIRLTYQAPAVLEVKGRPKYPCPFR